MKKIIQFLRSESFIFISVICVLLGQILHTAYLFESLRRADLTFQIDGYNYGALNWMHGVVCAAAIEAAMLMFLINGKKNAAKVYAIASFAVNVLYYQAWEASIPQIVASTLISGMLSGSIWFFSELFAERINALDGQPIAEKKDNVVEMSNNMDVREVRTVRHM
jgi:hypothetical protein